MTHSVLVVEDDPYFRACFVDAIRCAPDLMLAGQADDLADGLQLLRACRPEVLLVDLGLPGGSGIELIRHARQHLPDCEVMVVTLFGDERNVLACIEAGASGYLLKNSKPFEIVEQIRVLLAGGSPISPVIARQLLGRMYGPGSLAPAVEVALSVQEQTVLQLSSKGYTFDEIAGMMGLSRHTVETYVKRIYRKLQVHNKSEAIFEARKMGLMRD